MILPVDEIKQSIPKPKERIIPAGPAEQDDEEPAEKRSQQRLAPIVSSLGRVGGGGYSTGVLDAQRENNRLTGETNRLLQQANKHLSKLGGGGQAEADEKANVVYTIGRSLSEEPLFNPQPSGARWTGAKRQPRRGPAGGPDQSAIRNRQSCPKRSPALKKREICLARRAGGICSSPMTLEAPKPSACQTHARSGHSAPCQRFSFSECQLFHPPPPARSLSRPAAVRSRQHEAQFPLDQ